MPEEVLNVRIAKNQHITKQTAPSGLYVDDVYDEILKYNYISFYYRLKCLYTNNYNFSIE